MTDENPFADASKLLAGLDFARLSAAQEAKHRHQTEALLLGMIEIADSLRELERYCGELVAKGQKEVPQRSSGLILRKLLKLLGQAGVRPMKATGEPLDLARHEVVAVRAHRSAADDIVLEETVDGYLWNEQTLRRARVVISRLEAGEGGEPHGGASGEPR